MRASLLIGILIAMLPWTNANADVITMNDITGDNPSGTNPYTEGMYVANHVTASGIGLGSGITKETGKGCYNAKHWSTLSSIDTNDYFTFTLDANDGHMLNLESFVYTGTSSEYGPTAFVFRSSIDSFTQNIGNPIATGSTIDLSSAVYQHLTGPVEFRLYGYGEGDGSNKKSGTFSVNDYTFNGSVSANPEPQAWMLIGIGSFLMFWGLRRMRKPMPAIAASKGAAF